MIEIVKSTASLMFLIIYAAKLTLFDLTWSHNALYLLWFLFEPIVIPSVLL